MDLSRTNNCCCSEAWRPFSWQAQDPRAEPLLESRRRDQGRSGLSRERTIVFPICPDSLTRLDLDDDSECEIEMGDANRFQTTYEDLVLTITRHGAFWRVRVEQADDPDSALSGGTNYPSADRTKQGAISIALELFGTGVRAEELEWQAINGPISD